jgi:hypothetical protein
MICEQYCSLVKSINQMNLVYFFILRIQEKSESLSYSIAGPHSKGMLHMLNVTLS